MNPPSALAIGANTLMMVAVALASGLLLFVASHDGSVTGGRWAASLAWLALWIGLLAARRPPVLPDVLTVAVTIGGALAALTAPSVDPGVFLAFVAAASVVLVAGYLDSRKTVTIMASELALTSWLRSALRQAPAATVPLGRGVRIVEHGWGIEIITSGRRYAVAMPARRLETAAAALHAAGAKVARG